MKVLLVGATGVIGSQIVPFLKERFDLQLAAFGGGEVDGLSVEHCDITNWPLLCGYLNSDLDAVINCAIAPYTGVDYSDDDSRHEYYHACLDINARGAYNLFEAAWRARVRKFVYISSMTAVLGKPEYAYIERDAPERPNNLYAASKLLGEHAGRFFAFRRPEHDPDYAMRVLCLRLGMPFPSRGPTDDDWHQNERTRSLMVHVEDVAQAVSLALESKAAVYDVLPVVSRSDVRFVDLSKTSELGYQPRWLFTQDGMSRAE
jgi:nucleoside-diphosphate-sugar epimerase